MPIAYEGHQKGRKVEVLNQPAHHQPQPGADAQTGQPSRSRRPTVIRNQGRDQDRGEADYRTDRKINTAGENDQGHAQGGDTEKSIVGQEVGDDSRAEESVVNKTGREVEDDEDHACHEHRELMANHGGEANHGATSGEAFRWDQSRLRLRRTRVDWRRATATMSKALGTGATAGGTPK
jgi:hypothetical protein